MRTAGPTGAFHIEGSLGPGALYGIDTPAAWNGDLVLYMHGLVPPADDIELPLDFEIFEQLRPMLLASGYAVAYSSFSSNGYAEAEAARQTHQLSGIFVSKVGQPNRTFLIGQSLGGIVGLNLLENYPGAYDGGLLVSGVLGGTRAETDYLAHVRVVFDYFYPGALPGDLFHVPDDVTVQQAQAAAVGAVIADPTGLGAMLRLKQTPLPYLDPNTTQPLQSLVSAITLQWLGGEDFFDRTHRHSLFDNHDVVYDALAPGLLPQPLLDDLNAKVARWSSTPDAESWLRRHYEPTGILAVPLLTMHTVADPVVPYFHEDLYRAKVQAAGRLAYLLQRPKTDYGHTGFTAAEVFQAFQDLVAWVNTGIKPPA